MEQAPTPTEVYEGLGAADPAGRVGIVLDLVAALQGRPLDLSARDGLRAALDGVNLGRAGLEARLAAETDPAPAWWDAQLRGANLRGADLRGARLGGAILAFADLRKADLRDAVLGGADLRGARLEETDLRGADLAGAILRGAALGNADLRGAMLEEADLRRAGMRFAKLEDAALDGADVRRADLWGADLTGATLQRADLRAAVLKEATLPRADLSGALLRRAEAGKADFSGARLAGADLRTANVAGARFPHAVLSDANLQGLDLSSCDFTGVHIRGAALESTRLRFEQFAGPIGEENAGAWGEARKGYLALERYFQDSGDPDAASWAYRRRRRMQKFEALQLARTARAGRRYREAGSGYLNHASDQIVEWVCDYGESIPRVLLSMLALYLGFTVLYGVSGGVLRSAPPGGASATTRDPLDLAVYSLLAMTSGNTPSGMEPRDNWIILLAGFESLLGVALTGLLGFVMGNLVRR